MNLHELLFYAKFDYEHPVTQNLLIGEGSYFGYDIVKHLKTIYGFDTFTLRLKGELVDIIIK